MTDHPMIRVFISSPSDVEFERQRAARVIVEESARLEGEVVLIPIRWEEAYYTARHTFQKQIPPPSQTDIVVCILWKRLGSQLPPEFNRADGTPRTGTEFEFEEALEAALTNEVPDILVYRKTARISFDADSVEREQADLRSLEGFWQKWMRNEQGHFTAAYKTFETTDGFAELLRKDLRKWLAQRGGAVNWPVATRGSPFRSLHPFPEAHSDVFFGRRRVIRHALARLNATAIGGTAFLLVVGASGSGKSSLVQAGLVPRLKQEGAVPQVDHWRRCVVRPALLGEDPLVGLARELFADDVLGKELKVGDFSTPEQLADILRDGASICTRPIAAALGRAGETVGQKENFDRPVVVRLVLVIDQFEEVFGLPEAVRDALVAVLSAFARSGAIWVVATMRSDFYPALQTVPALVSLKDAGCVFDLLAPDPSDIHDIIEGPAHAAGLVLEETDTRSLARILEDEAQQSGTLPLLQFMLQELFDQRNLARKTLLLSVYDARGGLTGAIGRRAEDECNVMTPPEQEALPDVLLNLVTIGEDNDAVTARTVPGPELASTPERASVIERLLNARLLVGSGDESGSVVRCAHEALFKHWPRFAKLIEDNRNFLRVCGRVAVAERIWRIEGQAASRLLAEGNPLAEGEGLLQERRAKLEPGLIAYIEASTAEAQRRREQDNQRRQKELEDARKLAETASNLAEARQKELEDARKLAETASNLAEARQKVVRRTQVGLAVSILLAMLAGIGGWIAWDLRGEAKQNAEEAKKNALEATQQQNLAETRKKEVEVSLAEARHNLGQALFEKAVSAFNEKRPDLLHTYSAYALTYLDPKEGAEKINILRKNRLKLPFRPAFGKLKGEIRSSNIAFSFDAKFLASGEANNTVSLWEVKTGKRFILHGHESIHIEPGSPCSTSARVYEQNMWGAVTSVAFSPNRNIMASGGMDRTVRLWEMDTNKLLATLIGHEGAVCSIAFTPDGHILASGGWDGTVRLWEVASGNPIATLSGSKGVYSVAFSLNGDILVSGSIDKTIDIWEIATGNSSNPRKIGLNDAVRSIVFLNDHVLAAASGKKVFLIDIADKASVRIINSFLHKEPVESIAISTDKKMLAAGGMGTAISTILWDIETKKHIVTLDGNRVAFAPNGDILASIDGSGVSLWDTKYSKPFMLDRGYEHVAFARDGKTLLSVSPGIVKRVWEVETHKLLVNAMSAAMSAIRSKPFALSLDGLSLASGFGTDTVDLWEMTTGKSKHLTGHVNKITAIVFSPDGHTVAAGSQDNTVRLWNVDTGKSLMEPLTGYGKEISAIAFAPDGHAIASSSQDTIWLWGIPTGNLLMKPLTLRGKEVSALAFSPDAHTLASGSIDGNIQLWEPATGMLLSTLKKHFGKVTRLVYSTDGRVLASGGEDSTVQLWDTATNQNLTGLDDEQSLELGKIYINRRGVEDLEFSPDGKFLASVINEILFLWPLDGLVMDDWSTEAARDLMILGAVSSVADRSMRRASCTKPSRVPSQSGRASEIFAQMSSRRRTPRRVCLPERPCPGFVAIRPCGSGEASRSTTDSFSSYSL
ncbi:hypothetical protein CCP4SC76_6230002 [Gammaproteobacteria bacterium]